MWRNEFAADYPCHGSEAPRGGSCTRDVQVITMMYTHPPADAYHVMFAEAG